MMDVANILHMNTGDGESSYATNSLLQVSFHKLYVSWGGEHKFPYKGTRTQGRSDIVKK